MNDSFASLLGSSSSSLLSNSQMSSSSLSLREKESRLQHWRIVTIFICILSFLNFVSESMNVPAAFRLSQAQHLQNQFLQEEQNLTASLTFVTEEEEEEEEEQEQEEHTQAPNAYKYHKTIPLADYVPPKTQLECPKGTEPAPIVINPEADAGEGRKIPKIVHMTGKGGCLTKPLMDGAHEWSFENHSFYYHDDRAVDELLNRDWPAFPQLKNTMLCLENAGGAAKADLWRYLVIWEYGGIYTDMDNLPGERFNASTLTPDIDAFFLQESGGWISQYFFAASPHHPVMFLAIHDVMKEMLTLEDTGNFYVPAKTGPGATKRAFKKFMGVNSKTSQHLESKYSKPSKGLYYGKVNGNRTVLVEGSRSSNQKWCRRSAIRGGAKRDGFRKMNITNYQNVNKKKSGQTCVMKIHDWYMKNQEMVEQELNRRRW